MGSWVLAGIGEKMPRKHNILHLRKPLINQTTCLLSCSSTLMGFFGTTSRHRSPYHCRRRTFSKRLVKELSAKGETPWTIYLVDLRNHGKTYGRPGFDGPHTMSSAAEDLMRFAAEVVRCSRLVQQCQLIDWWHHYLHSMLMMISS